MKFQKKILDNGLSIIGEVNKSAKSAAIGFFVKTGARDETAQVSGVSHFLEHMLFKGTEKLTAFEVNEAFDRTGAQFNAFTSEEMTVFYAAVLPEYLAEITALWIELMRPSLRDDDFGMEKNVIAEEIAMYKDLPSFDVMDRCRSLHFGQHPCANSVLGTEQSIENLSAVQMRQYFDNRYSPNNMTMAVVGNFDWEKICAIAETNCGKWESRHVSRNTDHFAGSKKKSRLAKANLSREHICLMSTGVAARDEQRFAASVLATVVGDNVGSRFFWEIVDNALAETAAMHAGTMDGTGIFYSYISCGCENVDKVLATVERIFESLSTDGVSEEEVRKAKNKILSALVIKNELPMGRLLDLGFNWMYLGKYRQIEEDITAIKAVTVDQICSLIRRLTPGDFTQFAIGPDKQPAS